MMKVNHLNFLPSFLQIYFNLPPFLLSSLVSQHRKCPFSKLPLLWISLAQPQSSENKARPFPANLSPLRRGHLYAIQSYLASVLHPVCTQSAMQSITEVTSLLCVKPSGRGRIVSSPFPGPAKFICCSPKP